MPKVSNEAPSSELSKHTPMMLIHCTDYQRNPLQGAWLRQWDKKAFRFTTR